MDEDVKSYVDTGFNFLFGASFLLGPYAAPVGGIVSMAHVVFDALAQPDPKNPGEPLPDTSLHRDDLVELERSIVKDISELFQESAIDNAFDEILTMHNNILRNWNSAKEGITAESLKKFEEVGTIKNWLRVGDDYFEELTGLAPTTKTFITKCSHKDVEITAMPAFIYTVWTYLMLGKVCLMWELDDIRMSKEDAVVKAQEVLKQYRSKHLAPRNPKTHKLKDPTEGSNVPDEVKDAKRVMADATNTDKVPSYSAIVSEIKAYLPECISHLGQLIKRIEGLNYAYRHSLYSLENTDLRATPKAPYPAYIPLPFAYNVTTTPVDKHASIFITTDDHKDLHCELIANQYEPQLWQCMVNDVQNAGGYTEKNIANLKEVLHFWESVQLDTVHALNDMHSTLDTSHSI